MIDYVTKNVCITITHILVLVKRINFIWMSPSGQIQQSVNDDKSCRSLYPGCGPLSYMASWFKQHLQMTKHSKDKTPSSYKSSQVQIDAVWNRIYLEDISAMASTLLCNCWKPMQSIWWCSGGFARAQCPLFPRKDHVPVFWEILDWYTYQDMLTTFTIRWAFDIIQKQGLHACFSL